MPFGPPNVSGTIWTRNFEFASVFVDLKNRSLSSITWLSRSQTASTTSTPTQTVSATMTPSLTTSQTLSETATQQRSVSLTPSQPSSWTQSISRTSSQSPSLSQVGSPAYSATATQSISPSTSPLYVLTNFSQQSPVSTALVSQESSTSSIFRTAVIAIATAAAFVGVICIAALIIFSMRRLNRKTPIVIGLWASADAEVQIATGDTATFGIANPISQRYSAGRVASPA